MTNENTGGPKGIEDTPDYVVVHKALGQPRYTIRYYFIQLTTLEAGFTLVFSVVIWFIIDGLNLSGRGIFGFLSWDWIPFFSLFGFILFFSIIHEKRPDLKIKELISGLFVPTRFKDFPDETWTPPKFRQCDENNQK